MKKVILALLVILLVPACTETHEKDFTAEEVCRDKKKYDDPNDMRDEYDQCLLFKREELRNNAKCKSKCEEYCTGRDMNLRNSYTDFSGCHCKCAEKVKLKK